MSMTASTVITQNRQRRSRKRPRSTAVQHACKGAVLLCLLRCTSASGAGGGEGGGFRPPGSMQWVDQPDAFDNGDDWAEWRKQPRSELSPYGTPFSPPLHSFVERPDPMEGIRALALSFEGEDREELGDYLAMVLQKLANMNELFLGERARKDTVFHSASMPSVAVADFVKRIATNVGCPNLCLLLTLVYMDRLALPSSELHLYVTPLTAHRLFAASLIIAIKFMAGKPPSMFDNSFYEKMHSVTGLEAVELKHLEHHMLQALAKDAFVSVGEVNRYLVDFAPKHNELVPFVDEPYSGPPLFPFQ